MLSPEVRDYIDRSVLCWLATVDPDGRPNISPEEVFAALDDVHVVIANVASLQSVIRFNPQVCFSFVDVFVQKGYKLRGNAEIVDKNDSRFATLAEPLLSLTKGVFPIHSVIHLHVVESEPIVATELQARSSNDRGIANQKRHGQLRGLRHAPFGTSQTRTRLACRACLMSKSPLARVRTQ